MSHRGETCEIVVAAFNCGSSTCRWTVHMYVDPVLSVFADPCARMSALLCEVFPRLRRRGNAARPARYPPFRAGPADRRCGSPRRWVRRAPQLGIPQCPPGNS